MQKPDCDLSRSSFTLVNFSKSMYSNQIFKNDCICILYRLCKISTQIVKGIIFYPYDFLKLTLNNTISILKPSRYSTVYASRIQTQIQCSSKKRNIITIIIYYYCYAFKFTKFTLNILKIAKNNLIKHHCF